MTVSIWRGMVQPVAARLPRHEEPALFAAMRSTLAQAAAEEGYALDPATWDEGREPCSGIDPLAPDNAVCEECLKPTFLWRNGHDWLTVSVRRRDCD